MKIESMKVSAVYVQESVSGVRIGDCQRCTYRR